MNMKLTSMDQHGKSPGLSRNSIALPVGWGADDISIGKGSPRPPGPDECKLTGTAVHLGVTT
jgi:hypothetical protein